MAAAPAICFSEKRPVRDSAEIPALSASRKVVVTVENTMTRSPAMPRPAAVMMPAMSLLPVYREAPMPMTNIQGCRRRC